MSGGEAWRAGAAELARAYRDGSRTPVQALQDCLDRIDAVNPRLNAIVAQRREAVIAEAAASAERHARGAPRSPLDGVPVAVKDNIPGDDLPTTWGSVAGCGRIAEHEELALARLRAAGALVVGKTNCPEFCLEGYTDNALFGPTRNPWDLRLTPGGSSGGSVAAVAAGLVPLALGTDGGGSTRRPASHTGLVGFKPSIGGIPRVHALPSLLLDFEVIGPIARSVADVQLLFQALAGPDPADRRSFAAQAAARGLPPTLRVRYVPTLDGAPVDPQIAAACREAAQTLQALGHTVDTGPLPLDLAALNVDWPRIGQAGLAALFDSHPAWRQGAGDRYVAMAAEGAALSAPALWRLLETVEALRSDSARLFESLDLVLMPSAAALPWPATQSHPPTIDGRPVGPRGHAIFTGWVNAAGLPALALPVRPSAEGLPIGVQLIGPYGSDAALLALGARLEPSLCPDWRWPAL